MGEGVIRLTLPYPPSSNSIWRAYAGRNIASASYRAWQKDALGSLLGQRWPVVTGPYAITITAERPDKRRRDVANLEKPVSDALVKAGVVRDDSDAQRVTLQWSDKPPSKNAVVYVEIEPYGRS